MGAISVKDNYSLAAMLAAEVQADLLILMYDIITTLFIVETLPSGCCPPIL